ncbi:hypothetical protein BJ165DRAFT_1409359 [Panaeolus papilionaceus]|nr:hypothetical protein BJ165DRAFT_1409359 [Panaeolus papilionaceus]
MSSVNYPSGRLQVVNGSLFYSPNDNRTIVTTPVEDPNGVETARVFLPTRRDAATNRFSKRMEEVYTPRWWSLAWGWTAFIPIRPFYERGLKLLARDPTPHHYREKRGQYSMGSSALEQYCNLEQDLYHITDQLSMQLQISVVKPSHPTVFGFRSTYQSHSELVDSARASRDWFDVWVGLLCHLISETEEEQCRLRGFPAMAIMHWNEFLVNQGQSRATVQELNAECVCSFADSVTRVGTFLRLDNPKIQRPEAFVRRLQRLHVPLWYPWLPEYDQVRFFKDLGPHSSQIQDLLASSVPMTLRPPDFPSRATRIATVTPQAVLDFFAAREQEHIRLERKETEQQRQKRLQRIARPPTATAVVWVWERTLSGEWVRERVGQRERVNTLDEMKSYQKRYDPFFNEWNCCDELERPPDCASYEDEDEDEDEDDIYGRFGDQKSICASVVQGGAHAAEETGEKTGSAVLDDESVEIPLRPSAEQEPFVLPIEDMDDLAAIPNSSSAATEVDTVEEYVLQVLWIYYGFTPPLPIPPSAGQDIPEKTQNRFLKFVGIPLHRIHRDLFHRTSVKCAVSFMEKLGGGQSISDEESDLRPNHRESLFFNTRLQNLQLITDSHTGQTLYMFNFGADSTAQWHITLETAVHALSICRLPAHMEDRDIALYLAQHGIPFRTLQKSSTLPQMPSTSTSTRLIPYRPHGHVFREDDYNAYLILAEDMLRNHRLGRAALLGGGYPWRLAVVMLNPSTVLEGPSGWSTSRDHMFVLRDKETGEEYIDDGMTVLEGEMLCGLFECFTGNGAQTSRKSYYPLASTFKGSGMDHGRWTVLLENSFKTVREASSTGSRQPKTMTQWRDGMRGAGEFRRAQLRIEELSVEFVAKYIQKRQET